MRKAGLIAVAIGCTALGANNASAQNIYAGPQKGAYYGTLCPGLVDGLKPDGFQAKCLVTEGTLDNITKLLGDPDGLAMVQSDAFANWSLDHKADAEKLVILRDDLASEGIYFVSKDIGDFGDLVRIITRVHLVLPPKDSGPAQTFENMKRTLPRVFGKLDPSQVTYAASVNEALQKALSEDNTVALLVQLPDPANPTFKTIVSKKGKFIPVVAQSLVDEKIDDRAIYSLETRPVKAAGMISKAIEVTTLSTPIMIISQKSEALKEGGNARTNHEDLMKAVKTLPRERLLPKKTAGFFSRSWKATKDATKVLIGKAENAMKGL